MPKVTWNKPKLKVPPANHIGELLKRYQRANGFSNADLGAKLGGISGSAVSQAMSRPPQNWRLDDLLSYAAVLSIPFSDLIEAMNHEQQFKN